MAFYRSTSIYKSDKPRTGVKKAANIRVRIKLFLIKVPLISSFLPVGAGL